MLNIGKQSIVNEIKVNELKTLTYVGKLTRRKTLPRILIALAIVIVLFLFLPWTQNIRSSGAVTALKPEQRPQAINAVIAGKIDKWYVREGDFVQKGDTIVYITEIKEQYFDPNLIQNLSKQIQNKQSGIGSYTSKIGALSSQIMALQNAQVIKLEQARNKVLQADFKIKIDSADFTNATIAHQIAEQQFQRMKEMYDKGLKSLTDLETRSLKLQETLAKKVSAQNKFENTKNEYTNAQIELSSINADYNEKISKVQSDQATAFGAMYDAEADVTKMYNQLANYNIRNKFYYITAAQNGFITKAVKFGIGEVVKEGEELITIMPSDFELAVETYVNPIDLPLVSIGTAVRVQFDGWPAIVFSGWPTISYGAYGGVVVSMDKFVSPNGKYRILVAADPKEHAWPNALQLGAATQSLMMLKNVPVWYEIWRQLNAFPPDYYVSQAKNTKTENSKK
ncbi:MAG: HlyD family efflux transporter periplasmic adaptor subunit [Bacteroidetes bacterium]|nr:HlyD family efflux transporter periplasmic adaptor subunit [Bacteroidota bacterium]